MPPRELTMVRNKSRHPSGSAAIIIRSAVLRAIERHRAVIDRWQMDGKTPEPETCKAEPTVHWK
jgi:hypothetical protein